MKNDLISKKYHSSYFREALGNSEAELEFVYGLDRNSKLTKQSFIRLLNICRHKYKSIGESNILDINKQVITLKNTKLSNIRCTIEGIKDIQKYCKENKIEDISNISFLEKTPYQNPKIPDADYSSIFNGDYNFKINLKREVVLYPDYARILAYLQDFDESKKYFRYKKRFSFVSDDELFRIDLTAVKTSDWNNSKKNYECYRSFLESNILKNEETYEFEIEYIGSNEKKDIQTNETVVALDDFISKISNNLEKQYSDNKEYHSNVYSELSYLQEPIEEYKYDFDSVDEDEFAEDYIDQLFPVTFSPITSDPLSDIALDYWIKTDNEWLYDSLMKYNKLLMYQNMEKNKECDYLEGKHDFAVYHISPNFTDEEKEKIDNFPEDFSEELSIPVSMILNTSEKYKKETMVDESEKKVYKEPEWAMKHESREAYCTKTDKYEKIEKIIKKRKKKLGITIEYLIRWENKSSDFDEWKTSGELPNAQKMIRNYNNQVELEELRKNTKKRDVYLPELIDPEAAAEHIRLTEDYPLLQKSETFKRRTDNYVIENVINNMNHVIIDILEEINETKRLIPNKKKLELLEIYHTLTEQKNYDKEKEELSKLKEDLKKEKNYSKIKSIKYNMYQINKKIKPTRFVGPQPVSMSLDCLSPDNPYSILSGYVVTEKADGVRAELLITGREGYLITSKLDIIDTGMKFENSSGIWLFDGEYITKNIQNEDIKLYMIFDVYYASDGGVKDTYPNHAHTYPWISRDKKDISRSMIIHNFRSNVNILIKDDIDEHIKIDFKNYLEGPKELKKDKENKKKYSNINGIGKQSKKILDISKKKENGYEYSIDGLIYLPMFLSVKSMNEGEIQNNIGGTWKINYKWKPPEENTIDFRVRIVKEGGKDKLTTITKNKKIIHCKEIELYVDYNVYDDTEYDFCSELLKDERSNNQFKKTEILFMNDRNISQTKIELTNGKMLCKRDKVEIVNNMIVEMRYTGEDEVMWEPLRFRKDKNGKAQYFEIANKIWNTIQEPVSERIITGKEIDEIYEISKKTDIKPDNYYVGGLEELRDDKPLREFHNFMKSKLIEYVSSIGNKAISIMDTSIGQGGDIQKYLRSKNRINFLFALDISPDVNRAAKRFYFEKMKKPKALFMQYDTSEVITEKSGLLGKNAEMNNALIDILYGKNRNIPKKYMSYSKKYGDLGKRGFDIISSQFSFHYYCKNETTLRNYMNNLSENCKPGGFFIGTCYDGKKVFELLKESGSVEMKDEFDNLIYSIDKKYDIEEFIYKQGDPENNNRLLGNEIDVYMNSIGQKITEYLVNFDYIIKIMKEYDFELYKKEEKGFFGKSKYQYSSGIGGFELILKDLRSIEDKSLKGFYSESLSLLKKENQGLVELSSLNNWFIFQKKK